MLEPCCVFGKDDASFFAGHLVLLCVVVAGCESGRTGAVIISDTSADVVDSVSE